MSNQSTNEQGNGYPDNYLMYGIYAQIVQMYAETNFGRKLNDQEMENVEYILADDLGFEFLDLICQAIEIAIKERNV